MKIWPIDPLPTRFDGDPGFAEALQYLAAGDLVAVPTETVYGLAADATSADAVAGIFAAKERPTFNPLISHVESLEAAERHGVFDATARKLAEAFWPGPLTLVVERRSSSPICDLATAGLSTVGLRVPATAVTRALTAALGRPLAAPSANRSGRISATTAEAVAADLGERIAGIIDCGPTPVGVESTIVAIVGPDPVLLRPGGIPRGAIEELLGRPLAAPADAADRPAAPGMLASHYAPDAGVRLDAEDVRPGEALLAFGPDLPPGAGAALAVANLSAAGDLTEAAKNLFGLMRRLDASGAATIAVMPIPADGLGEAIRDRLARAAAPRNMHHP